MKICAIQAPFPKSFEENEDTLEFYIRSLSECTEEMDLILLPECSNCPNTGTKEKMEDFTSKSTDKLLSAVKETARRCRAWVAVNLFTDHPRGKRNTTLLFDPEGEVAATYYKKHLTITETEVLGLDESYLWQDNVPTVFDMGGIRVGFLTCYDIYFTEYIAHLAKCNPDIILFPSYERGERCDVLEVQCRYCALTTNAFILRCSVSMGKDSKTGGNTMLVSPDGEVLCNLGQNTGKLVYDIVDPKYKRMLNNSYQHPLIPAHKFPEPRRKPWNYRPAGSFVVPGDDMISYPRICAHRGFNTVSPENTMPAFASAIALGADEIELDVWGTKDKEIVVCHDSNVKRISDGHGLVYELTLEEISKLDAGVKYSQHFRGLRFAKLEDVLRKFARQVIINIHIKTKDKIAEYDEELFQKILDLIDQYDCKEHVYIAGSDNVLKVAVKLAPDISRCCLDGFRDYSIVERAIKFNCKKLQFYKPYFTQEMVDKARAHNIRCNVFWSDDPQEAEKFLNMGIDTILTNDYLAILPVIRRLRNELQ